MSNVVEQIGQMNFQGNIVPMSWFDHIKTEADKPDSIAILILSDIIYWYRPTIIRNESTGKIVGYKKKFKADKLQKSYEQIANQFGYSKIQIRRAIKRLEDQGLITIEFRNITTTEGMKISNVMYIEPVPEKIKEITYPNSDIDEDHNFSEMLTILPLHDYKKVDTYGQKSTDGLDKKVDTYTENTTENTTDILTRASNQKQTTRKPFRSIKQESEFDQFWRLYPKKRSKGQAEKTWVKINPDDDLLKQILSGLENAKKSIDWQKDGGQYIPYPSTWLNAKGWEDEYEKARQKHYVN